MGAVTSSHWLYLYIDDTLSDYGFLFSFQVQPKLNGAKSFAPAIDCVGFMTTPIWSGLFVSFILLVVLAISLTAILDIKTPSRFENSRSKQLTFTVQE